tara:strand:+ start:1413 stop:3428 length:2016 start_codon:yes stop_codon:yes gene_type:complete
MSIIIPKKEYLNIATISVNQTPLKWKNNTKNIIESLKEAYKEKVEVALLPELAVTGYGAEDLFKSQEFNEKAFKNLIKIKKEMDNVLSERDMIYCIGIPVLIEGGQLFNGVAILSKDKIHGIVCKQNLAKNGIHYEQRWFQPWKQGLVINWNDIPVGDLIFEVNGIRIGFEICEDSWVPNRPARTLFKKKVDVVLNPSASHYAMNKQETRNQFVKEGSRAFGVAYAYANLMGCEAGRAIYDGGNVIASAGKLISTGKRFSFKNYNLNKATIDIVRNRSLRIDNSEEMDVSKIDENVIKVNIPFESNTIYKNKIEKNCFENILDELTYAVALGLWDWQIKTKQQGFAVSLSGGADSAAVASLVYAAHKLAYAELKEEEYLSKLPFAVEKSNIELEKDIMPKVLITAYQASDNSGSVTKKAAKQLAKFIGAEHHSWSIAKLVKEYEKIASKSMSEELTWEKHDIAKQNIQARVRNPSIWFLANLKNRLLLTTSNLSESAVGYCTMDGDTAGVLAPIGGLSKIYVKAVNRYLCEEGLLINGERLKIKGLKGVVNQAATAELRPVEQTDEDDLMPFEILDAIRKIAQIEFKMPLGILKTLNREKDHYDIETLGQYIEKYYKLYTRNQWKRERFAVSFHLELDSLDPKTYSRFPVLNGAMEDELEDMWDYIKEKRA